MAGGPSDFPAEFGESLSARAAIMLRERGKPLSEAPGEIDNAASLIEFYAGEAKQPNMESVTSRLKGARGRGLA